MPKTNCFIRSLNKLLFINGLLFVLCISSKVYAQSDTCETPGDLPLDILINPPTCYGFSDGSVIVNIPVDVGDLMFTITDSTGEVLNEDNSNAANTLATG